MSSKVVALIGHGGDGKTTLADAILMAAGVTSRLGSVEDGTSFMNWLPEEKARRVSISAGICSFERGDGLITLLDAPGDSNFVGDAYAAVNAADHTILVLTARDGVKVGTEKSYNLARSRDCIVIAFVNKLDQDRSELDDAARLLEERLGVRVVKLQLPLGSGDTFHGYVDLLSGKAYTFDDDSGTPKVGDVPAELAEAVETAHMEMVEAIAEADDTVLEKYLEEGDISEDEVIATLRQGLLNGSLLPLYCGASGKNIGGAALLDVMVDVLPGATELPPRRGTDNGEAVQLPQDAAAPTAAVVWKSIADRFAGVLSVFRVVSGKVTTDSSLINPRTNTKERISKLLRLSGEETSDVKEVGPGEIGAIPKLKDTHSGDTLCAEKSALSVDVTPPPHGVISFAVEAKEKGDEDKVFESLNRLVEEDPSLGLGRDERTGEFLLTGMGQLHIEATLDKLRRLFHVDVKLKPPKVPYLETIHGHAERVEGKLKKQSGGRGQFGQCILTVRPGERGSGVTFHDEIVGGAIPRQFIPAVEKGVRETCERGVFAGYPMTDIEVHCMDGKHHPVDSSEQAFKTAASMGLKTAVASAKPVLLEPIMNLEVTVNDDHVGDVMGSLNSRRGKVAGVEARGGVEVVKAQVPMAEVLSYASDLTSMTGGQGSFEMEFSHYEEVPAQIQEKIVAAGAKEDED